MANWWFLWDEWRANGRDLRHGLLAAKEGFVLPDLSFLPTETKMEVIWKPTVATRSAAPSNCVLFLSGGSAVVPKAPVKEEFRRLVEAVIERLGVMQIHHSYIVPEWRAILDAEDDPEQRAFCQRAARLGCDPFDVSDSIAAQIEHLGVLLPEPLAEDFCDAISLVQMTSGAEAVKSFVDSASATALEAGRWRDISEKLRWRGAEVPWRDGYKEARALRSYLGRRGPITGGIDSFLKQEFGSLETREFKAASWIDAISAPTRNEAPLFGFPPRLREESKRFVLCRAISDYLAFGQPSLVTGSRTEHQQRNRAFAAEFLAPAESIKELITGDRVGDEDIEEFAQEFQVSSLIIRHQIQNHELAWLGD